MGSGGGGGDNGMMMMMMMLQMQQQQEAMRQQAAKEAFQRSQQSENSNYQRYQDLIDTQNKKVGDEWDLYNQNIDKIHKINPNYTAHEAYTFNPYKINNGYTASTDQASADSNSALLNKWYGGLDKQAFDDFNQAKSQYEASKTWLAEVQAGQDAAGRLMPGAPPGTWGAGGGQVSGGAGADALKKAAGSTVGGAPGSANSGVYNIAGGGSPSAGTAAPSVQGSGYLSDSGSPKTPSLGSMMGSAVGGAPKPKQQSSFSFF